MKIIFIHGRSQAGKSSLILKDKWIASLNEGFQKIGFDYPIESIITVPFYGDILQEMVDSIEKKRSVDIIAKGPINTNGLDSFEKAFLLEIAAKKGYSFDQINEQFTPNIVERGISNWEWVHAILKVMDGTSLGNSAIRNFTKDVYYYLKYPIVRESIDSLIFEHFTTGSYIVVGHSLGSVIGYNILHHLSGSINIIKFITLGSPLGIKSIQNYLDSPISMPKNITSWFNAFDEKDVVALNPLDMDYFPIDPPVINFSRVNNRTANRHGIQGYLNNMTVAREIAESIQ